MSPVAIDRIVGVVVCVVLAATGPAHAAPYGPEELAVGGGPGFGHSWWGGAPEHHAFNTSATWRHLVAERHLLGLEIVPVMVVGDASSTWGSGMVMVGRYVFYTARTRPAAFFLDWGIGVMLYDSTVPPGAEEFNFLLRAGAGLQHRLGADTAVAAGLRLQHVSNANRGETNPGVDWLYPFVELVFRLDQPGG